MTWWMILVWIGVALLFLLGLLGIVLPGLPGVALVFAGAFLYAAVTEFEAIGAGTLVLMGAVAAVALAADYVSGIVGAKKFDASRWGLLGAVVGLILGMMFFNVIGLLIGPLIGAIAFELIAGRQSKEALRAGLGTFVGFLGGIVVQFAAAFTIIGLFFFKVFS